MAKKSKKERRKDYLARNAITACLLCNHTIETRNHLFLECSCSEEIWKGLAGRIMGERYTYNWESLVLLLAAKDRGKITRFILQYLLRQWLTRVGGRETVGSMGSTTNLPVDCSI
ncbi:Uncharacterized protein Rs2_11185 [Raphanus sativus]|nr:Uncharacterized protein Rs2_11185 [Raphanus sativus]